LKRQHRQPVIVLIAAIIIVLLGVIFHTAIDRQMRDWKLLPEPERLTELYFTHPNSLPATYTPGQPQQVAFTVHNLEYRTTTYQYRITETDQDTNQSQTLTAGSFTLLQNVYKNQVVSISTVNLDSHAKVEVELVNTSESIDYLLTREGA
jgi:uncharacterized membrane protein